MRFRLLSLAVVLALIGSVSVFGQSTSGTITGVIRDNNHAPVADATVTVTNPATNLLCTIKSTNLGTFAVPQLPPGTYTVTVEKNGFKKHERTGVILNATDLVNTGDVVLDVGAVTVTVTVTADAGRRHDHRAGLLRRRLQVRRLEGAAGQPDAQLSGAGRHSLLVVVKM